MIPFCEAEAVHCLESALFDILLTTDGRTTEMLEIITGVSLSVEVLRQEHLDADSKQAGECIMRESLLIAGKEPRCFIVSHNFVRIEATQIPSFLLDSIGKKQSGIGRAMRQFGVPSERFVSRKGWLKPDEAMDTNGKPQQLRFSTAPGGLIPFKEYTIRFYEQTGIRIIEYFNPEVVRYRLNSLLAAAPNRMTTSVQ